MKNITVLTEKRKGIVADVLVNRKINNAKDKCKDAIRSVNSIRSDLVDLLKKYQENHED